MAKNFKEKLLEFVEAEEKVGLDIELLNLLHEFLMEDTLYFNLPPERRNTFNAFFKEMHSLLDGELTSGKYGASTVIDSVIVTVFETGYRLGKSEK
ncbi:MAG: hypothetical protein PHC43_00060 [Candidatus Marinimicrobia bacterium]|jgi:hypothetical protein|nr:hypothetical protein [Candidatus Neomarinimicrobiota bacterium]